MKKKIAVFASGWASQILSQFFSGLEKSLKGHQVDTYVFMCYPSWASTAQDRKGEFNILRLPHLEDFDGAIVVSNGLEFNDEIQFLFDKCRASKTPSISVGIRTEGLYYVGVDNAAGMKELCEHLITEHKIKNPMFLAGSKDNADSNLRLQVLKETMISHGLEFNDDNIFYTNWENAKTIDFVDDWCKSKKPLPDAFVCANDGLAMNTCLALYDNGFSVPKDTIVTGFDNIYDAKIFDPSISSVNQNYETLGQESGNLLLDVFAGKKCEDQVIIPCSFIPSESCCMSKGKEIDILRRKMGRDSYAVKNADTLLDRKLNQMERLILMGKTYNDIRVNLITALGTEFKYEGDSFHIVLEPSFELSIYNAHVQLRTSGYSSAMQIAFSMEKGFVSKSELFASRDLIPDHNPDDKEHLYIFIPIHDEEKSFGYFIMCDCLSKIDGHFLPKYQQRLNIAFERYRQKLNLDELNKRLTDISRIDSLTHVKNRMAYEAKSRELFAEIRTGKNPQFAIAMFDLNNLKKVNDVLGHNAGDSYIINGCRLICHTFAHSPVYRIGGDEFLAFLTGEDYQNWETLIESMNRRMEELKTADVEEAERVSIACGVAEYNPETDEDVQAVFKRADVVMYQAKMAMKGGDVR